jgi:hypothetical protein
VNISRRDCLRNEVVYSVKSTHNKIKDGKLKWTHFSEKIPIEPFTE